MNDFLKMDIFFAVTTVETVLITALLGLVIWKVLRILNHVERLAKAAGDEAEHLRDDAAYLRGKLFGTLDTLLSFIPRKRTHANTKTKGANGQADTPPDEPAASS